MTGLSDPDRAFALTHVPGDAHAAIAALWALDERLGQLVATTTQPMIGQMRLTWWYEALSALGTERPRDEPLLIALDRTVVIKGIGGDRLGALVEGWEPLLDAPLAADALETHAVARGERLFGISVQLLGSDADARAAGRCWALADFAARCTDRPTAAAARAMALPPATVWHLPRALRALVRLAAGDVAAGLRRPRTLWRLMASAM